MKAASPLQNMLADAGKSYYSNTVTDVGAGLGITSASQTLSGVRAGTTAAAIADALGGAAGLPYVLPLALSGDTPNKDQYKYITYTRVNPSTGDVYAGRSGGYGDPQAIALRRAAGQPLLNQEGFSPPKVDAVSTDLSPIRGREQQLIDFIGGAQSVGGSARNKINGVADFNPFRDYYIQQSINKFGALPDNSPSRPRLGQ